MWTGTRTTVSPAGIALTWPGAFFSTHSARVASSAA